MPFGENNEHVSVRLIDFDNVSNNQYVITNQYRIHNRETKIPDVVMMINGIPVVVGEAKTPIDHQLVGLMALMKCITFMKKQYHYCAKHPILCNRRKRTFLWFDSLPIRRMGLGGETTMSNLKTLGLNEIGKELNDLLNWTPIDILRNFSLYSTDKKKQLIKIIPGIIKYEGANKIVDRVIEGNTKRTNWRLSRIWKSLLMVLPLKNLEGRHY